MSTHRWTSELFYVEKAHSQWWSDTVIYYKLFWFLNKIKFSFWYKKQNIEMWSWSNKEKVCLLNCESFTQMSAEMRKRSSTANGRKTIAIADRCAHAHRYSHINVAQFNRRTFRLFDRTIVLVVVKNISLHHNIRHRLNSVCCICWGWLHLWWWRQKELWWSRFVTVDGVVFLSCF